MSRLGLLFSLIAAIAGLVAAHALALELPPAPGVTVTVPSLPVTTVPPPPLPAPTLPVTPPPPVTVPTPPVVTAPPPPQPIAPPVVTTPTPAVPPPMSGGSAGSTASPSSRSAPAQSSRPAASKRTNRLEATPRRSKNRVTVLLTFKLPESKRVFLIVSGPAPSCDVVGVIPVRGRSGANAVEFAGRVDGRNLRPGGYLLSISPVRRAAEDAPTTFVEVLSKRRSIPARAGARRPTCAAAAVRSKGVAAISAELPKDGRDAGTSGSPRDGDRQDDVLGVAIPGTRPDSGGAADGLKLLITIGILALIGALLLTMAMLVTRFVRGSWNP